MPAAIDRTQTNGVWALLPKVNAKSRVPLYQQVSSILVDAMRRGDLVAGTPCPSTTRLAGLLHVSMLTAHRALRSLAEEGWIERSPGRRTIVRRDIGNLLKAPCRLRICLAIPRESRSRSRGGWHWMDALQRALVGEAAGAEFLVVQYDSVRALERVRADAIVCIQPALDDLDHLQRAAIGPPFVVIGSVPAETPLHGVDVQHEDAARKAVRHLVQLGHQRLAMVAGPGPACVYAKRLHGFLLELGVSGLPAHPAVMLGPIAAGAPPHPDRQLVRLMQGEERPTALLADDARLAMGVAGQLRRLNLNVPGDVSLVAFDDDDAAGLFHPPLTVVAVPVEEMARLTMDRLMDLVHHRPTAGLVELLPTRLIVRGSTARPPSGSRVAAHRKPTLAAVV